MTDICSEPARFRAEGGPASKPERTQGIQILWEVYRRFNSMTEPFEAVCRPGCSACCTRNVTVTTLEARLILDWCQTYGNTDPQALCLPAAAEPRFIPVLTTNRVAELCMAGQDIPEETWEGGDRSCPLLENDRCRIYPARPFACRCMMSSSPCPETECAEQSEWRLALNTLFLQVIEDLDHTGYSGNLIDMLSYLGTGTAASDLPTESLVPNRPIRKLFVPPEFQERMTPLFRELLRITSPTGVWRSRP